jgi:phosphoribosylanthranilate isomerase
LNFKLKIKICGITNAEDAWAAAELGADMLGFVFAESRRRISPEDAGRIVQTLPPFVTPVGVFRNPEEEEVTAAAEASGIRVVQLHGDESPGLCGRLGGRFRVVKRIDVRPGDGALSIIRRMEAYAGTACLIDPGAGDGAAFDWSRFRGIGRPFWLAGGLNPENVKTAVRTLRPRVVDVSTGVEKAPGLKDRQKMKKFISEAR